MTLSKPADVFGVEMEADNFGTYNLQADFFEGATLVGSIPISVTTPSGSALFAAATNQAFTSVVLTNESGGGNGLGIAEPRYHLASANLSLTKDVSQPQQLAGQDVTYTINLANDPAADDARRRS